MIREQFESKFSQKSLVTVFFSNSDFLNEYHGLKKFEISTYQKSRFWYSALKVVNTTMFLIFGTWKFFNIAVFNSLRAKRIFLEKKSSNTNLFATLALSHYLFTSYCSVCAYKISSIAHKNLQYFAGILGLISLMLLWKPAKL